VEHIGGKLRAYLAQRASLSTKRTGRIDQANYRYLHVVQLADERRLGDRSLEQHHNSHVVALLFLPGGESIDDTLQATE
jgi:hypothetical protein